VRVPLSGFAIAPTVSASPVLFAVLWLTVHLGGPGNAAGVVAAAVGLMTVVAVLVSRRPRLATPVVLGLALFATGAASAGAIVLDVQSSTNLRKIVLPPDPSWVDKAHVGPVTLLQAYTGARAETSVQELFWNRSITRVALLPGAAKFDVFRTASVDIGHDGSLTIGGKPLGGPLLVDTAGSTVRFLGGHVIQATPTATLWRPDPAVRPRLRLYAMGRYSDGWLANFGAIYVWPSVPGRRVEGWLSMRLRSLPNVGPVTLTFQFGPTARRKVRVGTGRAQLVRIPICGDRDAYVTYRSGKLVVSGRRGLSVKSTAPVFTPDPSACTHVPRSVVVAT
jgi:hypothetical protein